MVTFTLNGHERTFHGDPDTPLLWVIRDFEKLTGTKYGCGIAQCGACTVHLDGMPRRSCVTPISMIEGSDVLTIEGIGGKEADAIKTAWAAIVDEDGELALRIERLARERLGNTPAPRIGEPPKRLLVHRTTEPLRRNPARAAGSALPRGQQFVAYAEHPRHRAALSPAGRRPRTRPRHKSCGDRAPPPLPKRRCRYGAASPWRSAGAGHAGADSPPRRLSEPCRRPRPRNPARDPCPPPRRRRSGQSRSPSDHRRQPPPPGRRSRRG